MILETIGGLRAMGGVLFVLALVCGLAWLARRGTLRLPGARARAVMAIETSLPLGERRSLMIVTIEGRRLLLGLTPAQVSLVTELKPGEFAGVLTRQLAQPGDPA